ncbi:unnamed protein product [Citrullus colocynthis]|uniref:Uncharacterized protein n=1 Tax=Citrullus colocynthis TaxID=252529 RepID=A0ABP0YCN8_9ROSI
MFLTSSTDLVNGPWAGLAFALNLRPNPRWPYTHVTTLALEAIVFSSTLKPPAFSTGQAHVTAQNYHPPCSTASLLPLLAVDCFTLPTAYVVLASLFDAKILQL